MAKKLKLYIPSKDAPGYLRRQRRALKIADMAKDSPSLENFDDMISFILDYVTEPADRERAKELLLDLSELEFKELTDNLVLSITGEDNEEDIPK